jgi:HD-GYP domain-containing protein (c-di-GMP phosphodiesterase class II)
VQRFIYASSCSVYGASDELLNEQSNLNPVSLYARAKLDSESILLGLNARDFHPTILRFGTVYGLSPRQRFDLVINLLTAKALDDGEITIFGGDQWRPFVHASDAARAVVIVLEAPLANVKRQIFNIGSDGQNYTIVQLGEIIHKAVPDSTLVNLGTDTDNRDYRVSFAKANRQLGFDPQLSVEQGVKEIALAIQAGALEHYKERKYSNYRTLSDEYGCLDTRYGRITEVASRSQPTLDAKSFEVALRKPMAWQMGFLESIVELAAISMDSATLVANRQRSHDLAVESWFRSLDRCQREVEGHTLRVAEMAISLARESGMTEAELKHLGRGALLHDIGQLGIPAHVLVKPGPLSDDEWLIVHNHPVYAYEILSPIVNLRASLDIPYCHHERWDGTGYPRGLKEENIPLSARVFSVVDVWDTLLSDKPYRAAWSREDVAEYILSNAGTQFDPYVVDAFARVCPVFPKSQVEGLLPHKRLP